MGFFSKLTVGVLNLATAPVRVVSATIEAIDDSVQGKSPTKTLGKATRKVVLPKKDEFGSFTGTMDEDED